MRTEKHRDMAARSLAYIRQARAKWIALIAPKLMADKTRLYELAERMHRHKLIAQHGNSAAFSILRAIWKIHVRDGLWQRDDYFRRHNTFSWHAWTRHHGFTSCRRGQRFAYEPACESNAIAG